jgi:hypothetical protein
MEFQYLHPLVHSQPLNGVGMEGTFLPSFAAIQSTEAVS